MRAFSGEEPIINVSSYDLAASEFANEGGRYIAAGEYEVDLDIPPVNLDDLRAAQINALHRERADLTERATECGRKIAELMSLPSPSIEDQP